ncbi:MAG: peptide chain release factor N(5)-glutamine methyltransferase [Selenomonadales bacterium]|nr:peptide chain release factor N(5)-glutamine methyltransferase [Selenomonadales bacterium]
MADRKEVWTIGKILDWTKQYFKEKGVDTPRLDAEVLLSHVVKCDRIHLYVNFDRPLVDEELAEFRGMVKARAERTPVAYILGEKEFMGHPFRVTPDVLIPRPDTEILVEEAIRLLEGKDDARIVDIGTGSGAILLSVLKGTTGSTGMAVDLSSAALAVAKSNAESLGVADRADFRLGDLYEPVDGKFDMILSNPPYIPVCDMADLAPEVKQEPEMALVGGEDGLDFYRRLIDEAPDYLTEDGIILFEVGIHQAREVAFLGELRGFGNQRILNDYAGIERVVILSDFGKAVEG